MTINLVKDCDVEDSEAKNKDWHDLLKNCDVEDCEPQCEEEKKDCDDELCKCAKTVNSK